MTCGDQLEMMDRRLKAAEANLEGMHRQLSEDWQAGQSSLRRVAGRVSDRIASVAVLSEGAAEEGADVDGDKTLRPDPLLLYHLLTFYRFRLYTKLATHMQRPPLYDGRSSAWDAYLTHFGMLNHWNEKATLLAEVAVSLMGSAIDCSLQPAG